MEAPVLEFAADIADIIVAAVSLLCLNRSKMVAGRASFLCAGTS
jgi:hypothetical protein